MKLRKYVIRIFQVDHNRVAGPVYTIHRQWYRSTFLGRIEVRCVMGSSDIFEFHQCHNRKRKMVNAWKRLRLDWAWKEDVI